MGVRIDKTWEPYLKDEFSKTYFKELITFIKSEYKTQTVYPAGNQIFNAFEKCKFDDVKVVILGQDPYHGENQAHGLAFSVQDGVKPPPSLVNIYKELKEDVGKEIPDGGNLEYWTDQGILLLNATLTVRAKSPGSHQNKGWEVFTDQVIKLLSEKKENLVFLLWGNYAQQKGEVIDVNKHYVLKSTHPSPFSARNGFFGCKHFSKTNKFLILNGKEPIEW
jgi:uracil-DNA glycosylase